MVGSKIRVLATNLRDFEGQFLNSELQRCHRSVGLLLPHSEDCRRRLIVVVVVGVENGVAAGGSVERRQLLLPSFQLLRKLAVFAGTLKFKFTI